MNKRTRNLLIVAAAMAVLIALGVVSKRGDSVVAVDMEKVKTSTFQTKLPESGIVQHPGTETVPSLGAGNIGAIYVKAGDNVSAGALLATVQNPTVQSNAAGSQADYDSAVANIASAKVNEQNARVQYQAAVDTAKSSLDLAQKTYDADADLYANKAIARQQLDTDRSKLEQARTQYDQAVRQLRLGAVSGYGQNSVQYAVSAAQKAKIVNDQDQQQVVFTRITAPFSGTIQSIATQTGDSTRSIQVGDAVTAGQELFTIARGGEYIVQAQVDEQDIINVHVGQQANVTGEDFPGRTIRGHVARIAPIAVKSTDATSTAKQVLTTIALDSAPDFLKDGMSVDVDIITTNLPHVLTVPSTAINRDKGAPYVYLVQDGKAVRRSVKTGTSNDSQTVITSGLAAGDTIVAAHHPELSPNISVTALPSTSPSPSST